VASAIRASHQIWAIYAGQLPGFSRFGGWHLYPLSSRGRILLRHCGGIVPPLFSSNIIDNASRQRASSIKHWNVHSSFAGLEAFLLRSRRLSGGFGNS
jgi:hypothetical protein